MKSIDTKTKRKISIYLKIFMGVGLFAFLLTRVDLSLGIQLIRESRVDLVVLAMLFNVPLIFFKVLRWKWLMTPARINYSFFRASLSYIAAMFVGLLTPGRLGELIRAYHLSEDCNITIKRALPSVLVDRLFDISALFLVGGIAIFYISETHGVSLWNLVIVAMIFAVPVAVFLNKKSFALAKRLSVKLGSFGSHLFSPEGWLVEVRRGLKEINTRILCISALLTLLAYGIFFSQCYLLGIALGMNATIFQICCATAVGSLVALLPISISGLGTREIAIVTYLGSVGVQKDQAFAFAILVLFVFYIFAWMMGFIGWCLKSMSSPVSCPHKQLIN